MSVAEKLTTIAENEQKVYEAGKQESKEAFWRGFTQNGARKTYDYVFFSADFSGETIPEGLCKPVNYDTVNRAVHKMFCRYMGTSLPKGIDCSLMPEDVDCGTQMFNAARYVTEIYDMGMSARPAMTNWYYYCYALKKIEKIRVNENTSYRDTFTQCSSLEDVTFEGVIGQNISFAQSPLTRESALSVINHLKDISGTGTTLTVTFSSTTKALLTDEDKAIATQKGWTIA